MALSGLHTPVGAAWAPDGSRLFAHANVDGNAELYAIDVDGWQVTRLTYTPENERVHAYVGRRTAFVDEVEVLRAGGDAPIHLLVGDSSAVTAATVDSERWRGAAEAPRWTCPERSICTYRDGWIVAVEPGRTTVVASLGGWRADTVSVRVANADPVLTFSEDFEGGIAEEKWKPFGVPAPVVRAAAGREGSAGMDPEGDERWESGIASRRVFDTSRGLSIDVWGRGDFKPTWPSWQDYIVALTEEPLGVFQGESPHAATLGIAVSGEGEEEPVHLLFHESRMDRSPGWEPAEWHRYTLQVGPHGVAEAWLDGSLLWRVWDVVPVGRPLRLVLEGRSTHAPVLFDDLKVYEGLILREER